MLERRGLLAALATLPFLGWLVPSPAKAKELKVGKVLRRPRIRVWKLGSLEHKIMPSDTVINHLAEILQRWDGKEDLDIVWSPDISVQEYEVGEGDVDVYLDELRRQVRGLKGEKRS